MNIYNVFYFNLYQKISINPLTNQFIIFLPPIIINSKKQCEVKYSDDAKSYIDKIPYDVKWLGWDKDSKWYNTKKLENFLKIV